MFCDKTRFVRMVAYGEAAPREKTEMCDIPEAAVLTLRSDGPCRSTGPKTEARKQTNVVSSHPESGPRSGRTVIKGHFCYKHEFTPVQIFQSTDRLFNRRFKLLFGFTIDPFLKSAFLGMQPKIWTWSVIYHRFSDFLVPPIRIFLATT